MEPVLPSKQVLTDEHAASLSAKLTGGDIAPLSASGPAPARPRLSVPLRLSTCP
eukprot:CAMPEP_0178450366 /NCGR_PEP_ID=MMETSP0689_2-20121128/43084_1 /TAXON_ID=160604 /ORGANISM="Amphidinium massartii, Strain CS-259" /LENGTH=53 /DNA_ID=CAMNT_0020075823 /DNA_START=548 /DNA_END=706 /DNA_ORIENTATION=+